MADTPAGSSSARAARRDDRRASSAVGVLGLLLAGLVAGLWISAAPDPSGTERSDVRLATVYDPPTTPLELVLVQGDGQLFAAAATDPLVRRPEQIRGGPVSHAYRMQRPMYGWLGWAGSGGQRDLVGIALVAITVVSAGALVWVLARHFEAIGADARLALLALAIPGVVADLLYVGPEILGTVLALVGFLRWRDRADRGGWLTLGCFALAILCRETLVLIPAAIGARELVSSPRAPRRSGAPRVHRRRRAATSAVRRAARRPRPGGHRARHSPAFPQAGRR